MAICRGFEIHQNEKIFEAEGENFLKSSVYFTPPETNSANSGNTLLKDSSTQTQELDEGYDIPKTEILVEDFMKWLTTMDGGCYNEETAKRLL